MDIHNGHLHAPYFIFIKSASENNLSTDKMDDDSLIKSLILTCQNSCQNKGFISNQHDVYITKTGNWIHIMDDWSYSLWHNDHITRWVEDLGEKREVFTCSAGEIDDTHEWAYFNNGLQRSVEFKKNKSGKVEKKVDFGLPLPGEWKANLEEDVLDKILSIANSLGISLDQTETEIWSYRFVNGKIVNTQEVFKRQEKTAAQRRADGKIKRSGKQILAGLFVLTLLIIFGGYHYFNEEALANRLAEQEQAAFTALMESSAGHDIKQSIYLDQIKQRIFIDNQTDLTLHLDSIYQDTLPALIFTFKNLEELTIIPSTLLNKEKQRKYQLHAIDSRVKNLKQLKKLVLENHSIKVLPKELDELSQLELLNLRGNGMPTSIVEEAKNWMKIKPLIQY